jgi:polyhydroxybutyrate depolymerase
MNQTPRAFLVLVLIGISTLACSLFNRPGDTTPTPSAQLAPGDPTQSFVFAGRERTYIVHLPPAITANQALPLVIALHGGAGNADSTAQMIGMSEAADNAGFIVVYPNGSGRLEDKLLTWNSGNCCGYALDNQVDDVGFVSALIDKMVTTYPIDPKRVYATGISNGGMMSYRLACELSDKIAAIAPVSGAQNVDCKSARPVSVIAFHGTADQHVLYDGGVPKTQLDTHQRVDQSVAFAMSFWAQRDGCAPTPQRDERGNIVHDTFTNCANSTAVEFYTIKGGGHAWPGGKSYFLGDTPTQEISATNLMLEFFAKHSRP